VLLGVDHHAAVLIVVESCRGIPRGYHQMRPQDNRLRFLLLQGRLHRETWL